MGYDPAMGMTRRRHDLGAGMTWGRASRRAEAARQPAAFGPPQWNSVIPTLVARL